LLKIISDSKKNTYFQLVLVVLLALILKIHFVFAENYIDFSQQEKDNFLVPSTSNFEYLNQELKDFIFPLNFNKDELENFIKEEEKRKLSSGWKYEVKKGENLWSISKKFKISLKELLNINDLNENSIIKPGDKIVIPGVKPQALFPENKDFNLVGKFVSALKKIGEMIIPVSGLNWGKKHSNNGTDIAAQCGQEVFAANDGVVIESSDGWNGGYGNYIIIRHRNGIYTLYGHLSLRVVEIGEKVVKGQLIGYVGNTGYTEGPTGCHLHFEVRGGRNPFLE
jgi:LysM repeat protein